MPVPFQIINVRAKNVHGLFATAPELCGLKTRLLKIFQRPIDNNNKNRQNVNTERIIKRLKLDAQI
jgi:hypothetical protein